MPSNYTLNIGKMSILLYVFIWQINNTANMIKLRVFRWGDFPGYYHSGPKMQSHVAF